MSDRSSLQVDFTGETLFFYTYTRQLYTNNTTEHVSVWDWAKRSWDQRFIFLGFSETESVRNGRDMDVGSMLCTISYALCGGYFFPLRALKSVPVLAVIWEAVHIIWS